MLVFSRTHIQISLFAFPCLPYIGIAGVGRLQAGGVYFLVLPELWGTVSGALFTSGLQ